MKNLHLLLALTLGSLWFSPQLQATTLEQAVCNMLEFEPELNAVEYDTLSAREDQKVARSELLPRITANASAGWSKRDRDLNGITQTGDSLFQRQIGLSIQQLLYDGGTAKNNALASRNALMAQQYMEKGMIEDRIVDLVEVYYEVLRTRRQIALAERNVENHQQMRDLLKERVAAGGNRADLALVQGRLGLALSTLASQRLAYNLAAARFERLTGRQPGSLKHPSKPKLPSKPSSVDLSNNHDYLAACEALEGAEHRAQATYGLNKPKFYFDAGVSAGRDVIGIGGTDNEARALVVGSWDLYRGGYNKAVQAREHFQVGKYEELKRSADIQRQYDLNNLWQQRVGSMSTVGALEKYATELSNVTVDYEEQFKVGRQELQNILDIQSEFYTATSQLVDAEFDINTTAFRILGVQGKAALFILGEDGCKKCYAGTGKGVVRSQNWTLHGKADPDCRVPVTQPELMTGKFDTDGPGVSYKSPRQTYYHERNQLPVQASEDCAPKGKRWGLFKRPKEGIFK